MSAAPDELEASRAAAARVAVACAAEHARAGRRAQAEELLVALPPELRGRAPVLDLRARLAAQGGRYAEAQAFWAEALRLEPADDAYAAARRRARRAETQPWSRLPWLWPATVVILGALSLLGLSRLVGRPPSPAGLPASPAPPPATHSPQVTQTPPSLELDLPGFSLQPDGATLVVTFEPGLFARGTRLTPAGAHALRGLARALERHVAEGGAPLHVTLVGHTDERPLPRGGRYRDNAALGLARAAVACDQLQSAVLPASAFSLTSAGVEAPRALGASPASAARRTVVVRLRRVPPAP